MVKKQSISVIFTNSNTFFSYVIRILTKSKWSHCVVVFEDVAVSAELSGVTTFKVNNFIKSTSEHEIITVPCPDYKEVYDFSYDQIGTPYDYAGLIGLEVDRDWQDPYKWFCSEMVSTALLKGGVVLPEEWPSAYRITPGMLYDFLHNIKLGSVNFKTA